MPPLSRIADLAFAPAREAIAAGRIPGAALGVVTADGDRAVLHEGMAQLVPERRALNRETSFDLASLTKVMFTTPRILAPAHHMATRPCRRR